MRKCPFHGCSAEIHPSLFACITHWYQLDQTERTRIYEAYHAWQRGEITHDALRAEQQQALGLRGKAE